jgi:hypothetical protein
VSRGKKIHLWSAKSRKKLSSYMRYSE